MKRKMLWIALLFTLVTIVAISVGNRRVAAVQTSDLYMKDTPTDTGIEPNPDTGPMWVTEDVWVRTSPDPNYQPYPFPEGSPSWTPAPHENPEYRDPKFSLPNYVYVRVRNRGGMASSGNERLKLYWAKASTGLSWDTQWVDFLASNCGPTKLYGAEITKPRKNAATATAAERNAYRDAILAVGTMPGFVFFGGKSYWHKQDEVHEFGPPNRHGSPAFLPWHREYINRYEVLLQEANPIVKLLYWDWTTDPENSSGFNFFTPAFMGASGRGSSSPVPIGAPFSALAPPSVTRRLSSSVTPPAISDASVIGNAVFPSFRTSNEGSAHNGSHGYIGGGGNISFIDAAAEDPFFFLLHGNADRIWAQWQRAAAAVSRLDAATTYGTDSSSSSITTPMRPWDGTGSGTGLIDPWTAGGSYIVSKSPQHASVVSPPIYDTAPLVIPALAPGEAVVIQIPWYPPNPADFACFGGDQRHFCLLARVETSTSAPFGMTFAEGTDIYANTRNNNNIAWKNITVVDDFPGPLGFSSILIRNVFAQTVQAGLRFANAKGAASFFNFGNIFVDLKGELFRRWRQGGGTGQGIRILGDPEFSTTIEITSPEAFIQNIRLEPNEVFSVDVRFRLREEIVIPIQSGALPRQLQQTGLPKWDLIQFGAPGDAAAIIGGQRFELDFRKLVLVPGGSVWRYLDDGSNPGPDWFSPTFNDSAWKLGKAELGFGDNPATSINGGPTDRRHITAYFRREFSVTDPGFLQSLLLRLKRDDGAVVYLNGTEIHRVNLPGGAIVSGTLATREVRGVEEEAFFPISAALGLLRTGRNVIAVEVHQNSARSEDLSFDLELCANPMFTRFAPDLAFASPFNGALFQTGQSIPIEVEALDSDGQVTSVSLFADGNLVATDNQAPFTFQLTGAALGTHLLRAVATDNDSQQSTADLTVSVLDNTPPTVELTEPITDTDFPPNQAIRFSATAADPGGAVQRVEFFVRDALMFSATDQLVGTVTAPPYTLVIRNLAPGHYMGTAVAIDNRGLSGQSIPAHFDVEGAADPANCNTICFRSAQHHLLSPISIPPGSSVQIGGVNSNVPTRNLTAIRLALQGGPNPLQQLNQQFVAAQLSLIKAGGHSSPKSFTVLKSPLSCYKLNFSTVTLSNAFALSPASTLGDLLDQARFAISDNRAADMMAIANILKLLNGTDPLGRCGR